MLTIIGSEYNPEHNAFEIYVSGCKRHCPGCHNPEAQEYGKGKGFGLWIKENTYKFRTGTFSQVWILGGDLIDQQQHDVFEFLHALRRVMPESMKLWLWTGHEIEDVTPRLRNMFDVVKTGDYQEELPSRTVRYGEQSLTLASENQQLHFIKEMPHA